MDFKDNIKALREEAGFSFADLASMVGKSEAAIRAWEYGRAKPDADTLISLTKIFKCSSDYLLGLSPYKNTDDLKSQKMQMSELEIALNTMDVHSRNEMVLAIIGAIKFMGALALVTPKAQSKHMKAFYPITLRSSQ